MLRLLDDDGRAQHTGFKEGALPSQSREESASGCLQTVDFRFVAGSRKRGKPQRSQSYLNLKSHAALLP